LLVAPIHGAILPRGTPQQDGSDFRALDSDRHTRHRTAETIAPNWDTHGSYALAPGINTKRDDVEVTL